MHYFYLVSLITIAHGAIIPSLHAINKRQLFPNFVTSIDKVAAQVVTLPVIEQTLLAEKHVGAQRKQYVWGPYVAQGAKSQNYKGSGGIKPDQHSDLFEQNLGKICSNCMILDARIDLTDKSGKKLPLNGEIYTHHIILSSNVPRHAIAKQLLVPIGFCEGTNPFTQIFDALGKLLGGPAPKTKEHSHTTVQARQLGPPGGFGAFAGLDSALLIKGHEANPVSWASSTIGIPKNGLWIGSNDTLLNSVEIVNYKDHPQDVYFTIDAEYISFDAKPQGYFESQFVTMVAMDCTDPRMQPPKDRAKTYSTPLHRVAKDSYLIDLHPHLQVLQEEIQVSNQLTHDRHDGAINMKFHVNDKLVCTRDAIYGDDSSGFALNGKAWETIERYTSCDTIVLKAGDQVRMTADYDLTKRRLRPSSGDHHMDADSMAMAFIQIATAI